MMALKQEVVADAERVEGLLAAMAQAIVARKRRGEFLIVGIRAKGEPLGRRLAAKLAALTGSEVPVGVMDITLYRDDLSEIAHNPVLKGTDLPTSVDHRRVILVDDVLFTGRTVRAAMDQIVDFGRPASIELAVLVDRGGRELPIAPDYVGLRQDVPDDRLVDVRLTEAGDARDEVLLVKRPPRPAGH
jgi:pyrimidine operon attenuation protein/uracil phosphoribosyltransferase